MGTTNTYGFHYPESSDPPNGAAQIQQLAEDVETTLSAQVNRLAQPPAAQLFAATNTQQFADNTSIAVIFTATSFDTHNGWNGSDTYTCPVAGLYLVSGSFGWGAVSNGTRNVRLEVNGIRIPGSQGSVLPLNDGSNHVTPVATPARLVRLAVGDQVKLMAWQTSGGVMAATGSVSTQNEFRPTLDIAKVRD